MKNLPVCVDASLVAALLLQNNHRVQSYWRNWREEQRTMICPALLRFEVVNVLHQYWRHDQLSTGIVQELISILYNLPIQIQSPPELHVRAVLLAQRLQLGATYDAHYVALAQLFGAELWTLDARMQRRFAETTPVVHLV